MTKVRATLLSRQSSWCYVLFGTTDKQSAEAASQMATNAPSSTRGCMQLNAHALVRGLGYALIVSEMQPQHLFLRAPTCFDSNYVCNPDCLF